MSKSVTRQDWSSPCHCDAMRRATRALTNAYDAGLQPTGLTTPQFALLRTVEALGSASISVVARRLAVDRTTLGRNLRPLVEAGYLDVRGDAGDARERRVSLTAEGHVAVRHALPVWREVQDRIAEQFGREKLAELRRLVAELETVAKRPHA